MRSIIVEDEKLAAERLKRLIRKVATDIEIAAILPSIEETVSYLEQEKPELIFMDIHLADGSSFSIFDQVKVESPIIFTTAYDEYALQAFKVNSIDYLLKPIEEDALAKAIQKHRQLHKESSVSHRDLERMLLSFKEEKVSYKQRFLLAYGSKIKTINTWNVAYFFAENKAVFLVEKTGNKYVVDETLDQLQASLDPALFFRINRGFLVSIDSIGNMYSYSRSRIRIELSPTCPKECIVSTDKTTDFKGWLSR
jgi:DNA-binding LytR/AlgR family response regulator